MIRHKRIIFISLLILFIINLVRAITTIKKTEPLTSVPTSIMVDSIEFLNSYNIQLTGHIMQRYPKSLENEKGIKFNDGFDVRVKPPLLVPI